MEFVCGGYFLTKRGPHGRGARPGPRGPFVTVSPEQVAFFPDTWALSWSTDGNEERARRAAALDIPPSVLPDLIPQVTELFDKRFLWPNVIPSVAAARELLRLVPPPQGWLVVGFAVAPGCVDELLERNAPPLQQPGLAPARSGGVFDLLARRAPLEPGFVELGFDVLDLAAGMVWHTNLDFDLGRAGAYGGTLNADGLLPDYSAARQAAEVLASLRGEKTPGRLAAAKIVPYDAYGAMP